MSTIRKTLKDKDGNYICPAIPSRSIEGGDIKLGAVKAENIDFTTLYDILFNDDNGSNQSIALSNSANNYPRIKIFFKTNDDYRYSMEIRQPYGTTTLQGDNPLNNTDYYIKASKINISGDSITFSTHLEANIGPNGASAYDRNNILITRVEGWKF